MNTIQPRLQYNYAQINPTTFRCVACFTASDYIPLPEYIQIPYTTNDYIGKYYNMNGDQRWYHDNQFQNLWEECPSHDA